MIEYKGNSIIDPTPGYVNLEVMATCLVDSFTLVSSSDSAVINKLDTNKIEVIRNDNACIISTTQPVSSDIVFLVEIVEKCPPFVDFVNVEPLRICISSNQPSPSSDYNFADTYFYLETYQETSHISDLEQGQTVGFSIANNFVYIFIDGVLSDRKELSSPVYDELWGVVNLTGRIGRVRLSLSEYCYKVFICSKSCQLYPKNVHVTMGTAVQLNHIKGIKKLPKQVNVWVITIDGTLCGWMNIDCLNEPKKDIDKDIMQRVMKDGLITCSILRIICVGPPGVGKTCLKHLLLKKPLPNKRCSTPLVSPPIQVSVLQRERAQSIHTDWVIVEHENMMEMMASKARSVSMDIDPEASLLPHARERFATPIHFQPKKSLSLDSDNTQASSIRTTSPISVTSPRSSVSSELSLKSKQSSLQATEHMENLISIQNIEHKSHQVEQFIYFTDSGGQPQFLDLLPIFLRTGTVVIAVTNLSEGLEKQPQFSFYQDDQNVGDIDLPILAQSNIEMIESVSRIVCSFHHLQPRQDGEESKKKPLYFIVGTHYDKMSWFKDKKLKCINSQLQERLKDSQDVRLDFDEKKGKVIFPLNVINDKNDMASIIRKKIAESEMAVEVKMPWSWYFFEHALNEYVKSINRKIVTLSECFEVGQHSGMNIKDVEQALLFLDSVNKHLYLSEFNVVITEPQLVFEMLSSLLKISFCDVDGLPPGSQRKLKDKGIFTTEVFEKCLGDFSHQFIQEFSFKELTKLLIDLFVIAPVNSIECFLPSALSRCSSLTNLKSEFTVTFDSLFLLPKHGIVLHGVFTALVVRLLSKERAYFTLATDLQQYRDAITLSYSNGGCVLLIDSFHWLQVCYSGVSPREAFNIQKVIKQTIYSISSVLPYNDIDFHFGFQCQLCLEPIHPARVDKLSANGLYVSCTKDPRKTKEDINDEAKHRRLPWIFNSDGSSTTNPELPDLMTQVAMKLNDELWLEFGIQLGLNPETLSKIPNTETYKRTRNGLYIGVFECWKNSMSSSYSWKTVVTALEKIEQWRVRESLLSWLNKDNLK